MKNNTITVTQVELDASSTTPVVKNIEIIFPVTSLNQPTKNVILKPRELLSYNKTGLDLEVTFLTENQYQDYLVNPGNYIFFLYPNLFPLQNSNLPSSKYILIKALTVGATADLRLDFLNYKDSGVEA